MKKEFVFRIVLAFGIFFMVYQFALKPMLFNSELAGKDDNSGIKISGSTQAEYDLIVYGEEPDGIAAAVSAARLGAKTLLLAEGKNLGGVISRCLLTELEIPFGKNNVMLNAGFLGELEARVGMYFSPFDYLYAVNRIVKNEKSLEVRYNTVLKSVKIKNHKLAALVVTSGDTETSIDGDIFIDSSRNGSLLDACQVPYTKGSEDLNLKDSYIAARLNFKMQGKDIVKIRKLIGNMDDEFYKVLGDYKPGEINTRITNFRIYPLNENSVIVQGLEISNVNVLSEQELKSVYNESKEEAKRFASFLENAFDNFKGWKYSGAAEALYLREAKHYEGLYTLSVDDVLSNAYFDKTIAMGSHPIQIGKFSGKATIFAGKPVQYGIPAGCLIPHDIDNLLMTGSKVSYSSLAASSAGSIGTGIATGNSAGILAVYCLLNNLEPADIDREREPSKIDEFSIFLKKQGLNFPKEEIINKLESNWAYSELRQLIALGLLAGGTENNYNLDRDAVQSDLAILLLNGIYRSEPSKYSLELDARIRPYFNNGELTIDKAVMILEALYDLPDKGKNSYNKVIKLGYIDKILQLSLKDKKVLRMDDVIYLSAKTISEFTKKFKD